MDIITVKSQDQIMQCVGAIIALRPHLSAEAVVQQVLRQQQCGYRLVAVVLAGGVVSVAGFRTTEFLAWGKILYIDDLVTLPEARGKGCASKLLDELIGLAKSEGCDGVHLDSGFARHIAHKLYLNKGFKISSHHFSLVI